MSIKSYTISNIAADGFPSDASVRHARRQGSMGYRCSDASIAEQIDQAIEDAEVSS